MASNPGAVEAYGQIGLFLGVETFNWQDSDWINCVNFCVQHYVDFVLVKTFDADSDWYQTGFATIYNRFVAAKIKVIPYGFTGTAAGFSYNIPAYLPQALVIAEKYAQFAGIVCLDIEGDGWVNQSGLGLEIYNYVKANMPTTQLLVISSPANPVDANDVVSFKPFAPMVDMWMPMAYNDYLSRVYQSQYATIGNNLAPTFDLSQEFGANDVLANVKAAKAAGIKQISFWEYSFATSDTALFDNVVKTFKGITNVTTGVPQGWVDNGTLLTAPNGISTTGVLRTYVLNHIPWRSDNVPIATIETGLIEEYNPQFTATGIRQLFKYEELGAPTGSSAYTVPIGQELAGCRKERDQLKVSITSLQQSLAKSNGVISQLQQQIAQLQQINATLQKLQTDVAKEASDIGTVQSDQSTVNTDVTPSTASAPTPLVSNEFTNGLGEKITL